MELTGPPGSFIVELDSSGQHRWSDTYEGLVATDRHGHMFVTALKGSGAIFDGVAREGAESALVKLSQDGRVDWVKRWDAAFRPRSISTAATGDVSLIGELTGTVMLDGTSVVSTGRNDLMAVKLNDSGQLVWARNFAVDFPQIAPDMVATPAGGMFVAGRFRASVDFGGGVHAGTEPNFLLELDGSGRYVWSQSFAPRGFFDQPWRVAHARDGFLYVAGASERPVQFPPGVVEPTRGADAFVAKLNPALMSVSQDGGRLEGSADSDRTHTAPSQHHIWSKRYGDATEQMARDLALDAEGAAVLVGDGTGITGSPLPPSGKGVFVIKIDADGVPLWNHEYVSAGQISAGHLAVDSAGGVFATFDAGGDVDFGGGVLVGAGGGYLLALEKSGAFRWSLALDFEHALVAVDRAGNATGFDKYPHDGYIIV